jgi:hypothetical protein
MISLFNDTTSVLLDKHAQTKTVTFRERPSNLWFDNECRVAKVKVRALERRYQSSNDVTDRELWVSELHALLKLYYGKKSSMTVELIDADKDCPKRLWRTLNSTLGLSECRQEFVHSADDFAQYFSDKIANIRISTAGAAPPSFSTHPPSVFSDFRTVTEADVISVIVNAPSKQCELDPIPTWLLKKCVTFLAPFLTVFFNQSLSDGIMPDCMKIATVTPLLKKHNLDPTDLSNYRPVSNLSFLSKILEKIAGKPCVGYLESNMRLPKNQSAYRAKHSTETALLRVYSDLVASCDSGKISLLALLDLSAAFDTVDHAILLQRLSSDFGVQDSAKM